MRVTLLPREAAARVITASIGYLAWAAGAVIIVFAIPVLVETLLLRGVPGLIPVPLTLLLMVLAAIIVAITHTRPPVVLAYLVIATVAALVYEVTLIEGDPGMLNDVPFLVNRLALVLVTIGVAASTAIGAIAWCALGYAASWFVSISSALLTGTEIRPGFGPTFVLALSMTMNLTLFAIQVRQRRRLPRFEELEQATRRRAASADLAQRTTAIVHDTVLNDLTLVMNAPDTLDVRTRERLREDLDTLAGGAWMHATSEVAVPDEAQAVIRNELARLASEFRWRGLSVNVTGVTDGVYIYDPVAGEALIGALRATFENVLQHSERALANVEIMYSDTAVTFMVSDDGVGFVTSEIDANRLGVRESIVGRMEAAGGSARIWSAPGAGTTVMLSVPVLEVRDPGAPSPHQGAERAE